MLKEVGATSRNSTILIPHSPGGLEAVMDQIRSAIMVGNEAAKSQE